MHDRLLGNMLKYDTQDKEPNLYSVLVLAIITAAAVMLMVNMGAGVTPIIVTLIAFFVSVVFIMSRAYVRQLQCNPYSYNMIYYRGFALFFCFVLLTHLGFAARIIRNPDRYVPLDIFLSLMDSALTYVVISLPVVLVFSIWLCVSNVKLIKHEGRRLANVLGIILAFLMIGGLLILIAAMNYTPDGTMRFVWEVTPDAKVVYSTTNYHVFRAGLYARSLGMRAVGIGQPTIWWFWPNAAVREFVGLMTEHKKRQMLILVCLIITYTVLTLLSISTFA